MSAKALKANRKYVFVCGLERSGTTVLARNLARLDNCTGFKNTGVRMDEGQYLQNVYPPDPVFGGAGWYGFDARAHLTEESDILTAANIDRLRKSWHAFWDESKNLCLEKTPGNLIRTRFLQAAFPNAYFIVIRRHPVPVSLATQKWSMTSLHRLFEHWLTCDDLFEEDKNRLRHVYELTYEDYIKRPAHHHQKIAAFLGTSVSDGEAEELTDVHNKNYFKQWCKLLEKSSFRVYYRYIARKYEPRFTKRGYSLIEDFARNSKMAPFGGTISQAVGSWSCFMVDARWRMERQLRAILPFTVKNLIRYVMGKEPKTLVLAAIPIILERIYLLDVVMP